MQKPILTIAFDDGYLETYKHAISYLDKVGIKCTFAIPVGLVGKTCEKRPVVKWVNLKKMHERGHDIASHTLHHKNILHLGKLGIKKIEKEIIESREMLRKHLGPNTSSFVYPYIHRLPGRTVQRVAENKYSSSRISEDFPVFNKLPLKNPFSLKGFCVNTSHNLKDLEDRIDQTIQDRSWLIEVFHLVGKKNTQSAHRNKPYRFFMHIDEFKKHIDSILAKDISILTQKEVIEKYVFEEKL